MNSNVFILSASTVTSIPLDRFSAVKFVCACPPIFMLPSTNSVPSGIVSFTFTVSDNVPVMLSNFIVYYSLNPICNENIYFIISQKQ